MMMMMTSCRLQGVW